MRVTAFLAIAALTTTGFVAGERASEGGAWIGSSHADATLRLAPAADPQIARALPLQCLLPPSRAGEEPAFVADAPSKSGAHPLRIASPPQGPPA